MGRSGHVAVPGGPAERASSAQTLPSDVVVRQAYFRLFQLRYALWREGTGRPLGQPAIPNDYPLSALGRRLRSAIRS